MKAAAGIRKLYYSIGEISELVEEETHVLRFWESQFDQLRPRRSRSNRRIYTLEDLALIEQIKQLLKVDKYTMEGAKQVLDRREKPYDRDEMRHDLLRIRSFLENIERQLDNRISAGT